MIFRRLRTARYVSVCLLLLLTCAPLRAAKAQAVVTQAAAPSLDNDLVSYWLFDEGSGTTAVDYGGSGNNVTLHGTTGFTNITPPLDHDNPSALKTALDSSSYASAPGTNIDSLKQFTIAMWVRLDPNVQQGEQYIISLGNGKARIRYFVTSYSGNLYFDLGTTKYQATLALSPYTLIPGKYYHIALSYDGGAMRVYIDGGRASTFDLGVASATGNGVQFGDPAHPFGGAVDDVRVYARPLSDTEVARLAFRCGGVTEIPQAECAALADLYFNTNGAAWTNHAGWLANNSPCSWYGVLCNNGHVFLIGLPNNNLNGVLPLTLNNLSGLTSLGLAGNKLSGPIPGLLAGLTSLQTLDLGRNQLSGELPAQLGYLTSLQALDLNSNKLSGDISTLITRLSHLTALNLNYNALHPSDPGVQAFLTARQATWAATQTVAPTGIQLASHTNTTATLQWAPIDYTGDGGYYEVLSLDSLGVPTLLGKTADKKATGLTVAGLTTGANYSLVVRAVTPAHGTQLNDVTSDDSPPLTFTQTPQTLVPAMLTVVLDIQPDSVTNFKFTGTVGTFYLDDSAPGDGDAYTNTKTFSITAGTYTIAQNVPSGWFLGNIGCNPPAGTIADLVNRQLTVTASSGANITCTFTVQRAGQVIGGSYNDHNHNNIQNRGDKWLGNWQMDLHENRTAQTTIGTTGSNGRAPFKNLAPGSYTICENVQNGWFNISPGTVDTTYGLPCYTVDVSPGQAVWARFGNSITPPTPIRGMDSNSAAPLDIVVCDLPPTNDAGDEIAPERDPWEEQEDAFPASTVYLPMVER